MYMFFYSLFTIYLQLYTNSYNSSYIQNNSHNLYTVPESTMSVRQGRDTVWENITFCTKGGQTGFLNFYSINYMISGFQSVESSRG